MTLVDTLVDFSHKNGCSHIPSALSMLTYVNFLFKHRIIQPFRDRIVLGKPFGSQAYYIVWKELGYLDNIENLSVGVKHYEIPFVDYSEETMGNALGVSIGIALAHPDKRVWVNLSDATLQMGSTLEAIQYIGQNKLKNIFLTVDNNNCQVTGHTSDVIDITPVIKMTEIYGWRVVTVNGHDETQMKKELTSIENFDGPILINFLTQKGYGVDYMQKDPIKWHYKLLQDHEI
jgi:transketolase